MVEIRQIVVENTPYQVTISDEEMALSAAYAAGGAIIGLWNGTGGGSWLPEYVAESMEAVDGGLLERAVRRRFRLPLIIGETKRLIIREFTAADAKKLNQEMLSPESDCFYRKEPLCRYIHSQYRFFEYGIWALVEKVSQSIIGMAGLMQSRAGLIKSGEALTGLMQSGMDLAQSEADSAGEVLPLELGYHVFMPFRRRGYGREACGEIMSYASRHITGCLHVVIQEENEASRRLAASLGFRPTAERYSGLAEKQSLYVWNCPEWPKQDS